MKQLTKRVLGALLVGACLVHAGMATAFAQARYPEKPVKVIVPFGPGTSPDIVARYISQKLSDRMGAPFVVENRVGAGGSMGAEAAARSAADGYSLLFVANSIVTINQFVYKNINYKPEADFAPVALVASVPYIMVANKNFQAKTLADLIRMAKENPKKIDYASNGVGGGPHVVMELFARSAGIQLTHIPYKGTALADVLGGQVPLMIQAPTTVIDQVKAGHLIALATTRPQRLEEFPDAPSISEVVPGFSADGWLGFLAPSGTPGAIIEQLNREIRAVLALPETTSQFKGLGIQAMPSSPAEMKAVIAQDSRKWGQVIKDIGLVPQ